MQILRSTDKIQVYITEEEYFVWLVSKLKFYNVIIAEAQAEKLKSINHLKVGRRITWKTFLDVHDKL